MAELTYWEIDGPYTPCDGQWHSTTATNTVGRDIQLKYVELALAIDNGTTGDIGLYLTHAGKTIAVGSFTIQTQYAVNGWPLRQSVNFGADWITVPAGQVLTLAFVGSTNQQPARNYIPVARMYYI